MPIANTYPGYIGTPIAITLTPLVGSPVEIAGIISATPPSKTANDQTFVPASGDLAGIEQVRATHLKVAATTISAHVDKTTYAAVEALAGTSMIPCVAIYGEEVLTYTGTVVISVEPQEFSAAIAECRFNVKWDGGLVLS